MVREAPPGSPPPPTSPFPGDPQRSTARCPQPSHRNSAQADPTTGPPAHWDGVHWRCYRRGGDGHIVDDPAWGPPGVTRTGKGFQTGTEPGRGRGFDSTLGPVRPVRLTADQETRMAPHITRAAGGRNTGGVSAFVRDAVQAHLDRLDRKARRDRPRDQQDGAETA